MPPRFPAPIATRVALLAVAGIAMMSSVAAAEPAPSDVPILVLVNDGEESSIRRTSGISQAVLVEVRDRLARDGFEVRTEEALAAAFDWDLGGRRGTEELLRLARAARASGRPELDVRAVVILTLKGAASDRGFGTEIFLSMRGEVHDASAGRQLAHFGPLTRKRVGAAGCESRICIEKETAPLTRELAALLGDEARRELAQLTRASLDERVAAADAPVAPFYASGLATTWAIEFEHFEFSEYLSITRIMQDEFPGFVRARDMQGTPRRGIWGYVSRAPGVKLYEWVNLMLIDLGLSPDRDVQVIKDGSTITLRKLAAERPRAQATSRAVRFP